MQKILIEYFNQNNSNIPQEIYNLKLNNILNLLAIYTQQNKQKYYNIQTLYEDQGITTYKTKLYTSIRKTKNIIYIKRKYIYINNNKYDLYKDRYKIHIKNIKDLKNKILIIKLNPNTITHYLTIKENITNFTNYSSYNIYADPLLYH